MKQFIFLLLLLPTLAYTQNAGMNGAGFFENYSEQAITWIDEAVGDNPWTLRIPSGAGAKFMDPFNNPNGWGLSYEGIDSILQKYGSDEEEKLEGALEKWKRKADAQPDHSYLDDVIALQKRFPNMQVIYAANIYIGTEAALYPIDYLIAAGVNVVGVEMGNETYSQLDYDFVTYRQKTEPIATALRFKKIPVYHPIPATGTRNTGTHQRWIDELNAVIDVRDGIAAHPYYDGREFSSLAAKPIDHDKAFGEISACDFDKQFSDIVSQFKTIKKFIITEFNSQPADLIGNTAVNAFLIKRIYETARKYFQHVCIHNGISPDVYGIIFGRPGAQQKNTSYDSFAEAVVSDQIPETEIDTLIENCRDTLLEVGTQTQINTFNDYDTVCIKRFMRKRICFRYLAEVTYDTIFLPVYDTRNICDTTIIFDADTIPDIPEDTVPEDPDEVNGGCEGNIKIDASACKSGNNDDYLHPERFINDDGTLKCQEGVVIFDHFITLKFDRTIIPAIAAETGITIDKQNVDFYITNPTTGEQVVFKDIFYWCDANGVRTIFNTNAELAKRWPEFKGQSSVDFPVQMIDRDTGILISILWRDHETMTLIMKGI